MSAWITRFGKAALAAAVGVAAVGLAAGVGTSEEQPRGSYTIGLIAKSQSNPVFLAARTGAEDAARELGDKYGVKIKIDWRTPVSEDAQKQAEYLEQLAAGGADAIAVSASDANTLKLAIDTAVDAGVPVVTFDSDVATSKRFAYYGTDDEAAGRRVAAELAKAMGDEGVVAILAGNQNAPNLQKRVKGVREELAKHPNIKILDTYYHAETPQEAAAKMEEVQRAHPEITGWALVGGWPLFTQNALDNIAPYAKVVSMDALRPQLVYVKNGQVDALLAQKVYEWGYESVRLAMEKLIDGKQPADPIVKADLVLVTAENADEYGKNWAKWLGEK